MREIGHLENIEKLTKKLAKAEEKFAVERRINGTLDKKVFELE